MLFGAGLVAGLLGPIGDSPQLRDKLGRSGPSRPGCFRSRRSTRRRLHALTGETSGITGVIVHLGPLGGAQPAGPLLAPWVLAYTSLVVWLAGAAFARRDL